jgi:hypothetical protein
VSKTQFLATHYNDIVKNNALPINAFTEIMVALVRKPMQPFMAQAVKNIQKSVGMLVSDNSEDDSSSVAGAPNFRWRKLFHGIKNTLEFLR